MRVHEHAPTIDLRDPLAEMLGELKPGETLRYRYEDAVKLAGHSCPTIAGAWLVGVRALRELCPGEVPARGSLEVTVGGSRDHGSAGPWSQVFALLTGAAPETGFAGLMGRHRRKDLLVFDAALGDGTAQFRRPDTGAMVLIGYDPSPIPPAPEMGRLLAAVLGGRATDDERARFGDLWQGRVDAILAAPDRVLTVKRLAV